VQEVQNKFFKLSSPLKENILIPRKCVAKYEFTAKFEGTKFSREEALEIADEFEGKESVSLEFLEGEKILIKTLIAMIKRFNTRSIEVPIYRFKNSELKELLSVLKPDVQILSVFLENGT
jgi:predicted ATP-grasp superfamily ATP-dependent carboligase